MEKAGGEARNLPDGTDLRGIGDLGQVVHFVFCSHDLHSRGGVLLNKFLRRSNADEKLPIG